MARQKARFFCEFCGTEVKKNDKICSHCGRFFASVRCPKCNCTGTPAQFSKGCPNCGYALKKDDKQITDTKKTIFGFKEKKQKNNIDALPAWIYFVCFFVAVLLIIFVIKNVN